ncbi:MAG TPA: hypothetical protein VIF60_23170 [Burkholderiaceae bacterium]
MTEMCCIGKMVKLTPERHSRLMSQVMSKNTTTELAVRPLVFAFGYCYRLYDKRLPGNQIWYFLDGEKLFSFMVAFGMAMNNVVFHDYPKCESIFGTPRLAAIGLEM